MFSWLCLLKCSMGCNCHCQDRSASISLHSSAAFPSFFHTPRAKRFIIPFVLRTLGRITTAPLRKALHPHWKSIISFAAALFLDKLVYRHKVPSRAFPTSGPADSRLSRGRSAVVGSILRALATRRFDLVKHSM